MPTPAPQSQGPSLYDNILQDAHERQLERNLGNAVQADRLRHALIAAGKNRIDEEYNELEKGLIAQRKIYKSSLINRAHMLKAQLRFKMCQEVFAAVLARIKQKIAQQPQQYQLTLIKFIVEGSLRMSEPKLLIKCLETHRAHMQKILPACVETFSHIMHSETSRQYPLILQINTVDVLEERQKLDVGLGKGEEDRVCIGGVVLTDLTGDIVYKNTVDSRLNILRQIYLPVLREMLWPRKGSPNKGK